MLIIYVPNPAFYTPLALVEEEKKAKQENATALLSRAVEMCDDKKVVNFIYENFENL